MDHQDSINICVFEQSEELLFSDLSGPLSSFGEEDFQKSGKQKPNFCIFPFSKFC